MEKSRSDADRGEKARSAGAAGLDPATAAFYANMLGGAGGVSAYAAAAAAASGMGGSSGWPGFSDPRSSSAAGLASLAAAQQAQQQAAALASMGSAAGKQHASLAAAQQAQQQAAVLPSLGSAAGKQHASLAAAQQQQQQQQQQAAALASMGSAAAWYQMAGLQQMEMLSRLQGGAGLGAAAAAANSNREAQAQAQVRLQQMELLARLQGGGLGEAAAAAALMGGRSSSESGNSSNSTSREAAAAAQQLELLSRLQGSSGGGGSNRADSSSGSRSESRDHRSSAPDSSRDAATAAAQQQQQQQLEALSWLQGAQRASSSASSATSRQGDSARESQSHAAAQAAAQAAQANALAAAAAAGLGGYHGLHPEHLMNLEMLQAQHVMAAALAASSKASALTSKPKPLSVNSTISMSKSMSLGDHRGNNAVTLTTSSSSRPSSVTGVSSSSGPRPHSSTAAGLDINRLAAAAAAAGHPHSQSSTGPKRSSSNYHTPSPHRYSSPMSESSLRDSSPSLSYGIASLMAEKHTTVTSASQQYKSSPSPHAYPSSHARTNSHQAERVAEKLASNGSVSISKAIRNKELEIIPISPAGGGNYKERSNSVSSGSSSQGHHTPHSLSSHHHRDKTQEPKVSISTVTANHARGLPNGLPNSEGGRSSWAREESASVSIEPCGTGNSTRGDDAPLNLSMKSSTPTHRPGDKRGLGPSKEQTLRESLLGQRGGLPSLIPGLGPGGTGSNAAGDLTPSLEVLQSLYASQAATGEPTRDIMQSMQEALQRQLMGQAYDNKREDKKKRMEEAQERARHLGRGISKPKKNTVASLLEQCRAQGIKPQLPLPGSTSIAGSSSTATSSSASSMASLLSSLDPAAAARLSSLDQLKASSIMASTASSTASSASSSPVPSSATAALQSLPPTLPPTLPPGLPPGLTSLIPGLPPGLTREHLPPSIAASLALTTTTSTTATTTTTPASHSTTLSSLSISAVPTPGSHTTTASIPSYSPPPYHSALPLISSAFPAPPHKPVTSTATPSPVPLPPSLSLSSTIPPTSISVASNLHNTPHSIPTSLPASISISSSLPGSVPFSPSVPGSIPLPSSTPGALSLPPSTTPTSLASLPSSVSISSVSSESSPLYTLLNRPSVSIHPSSTTAPQVSTGHVEKPPNDLSQSQHPMQQLQGHPGMENSVDVLSLNQPQENGEKHSSKKRHMITSSSVDGRLITTIKAAATAGDSELSDSDSDDESTSWSSIDEETLNHIPSPWLKRDRPDSQPNSAECPPNKKRKMITDEASLRVPMMHGWKRETAMRFITQSGVRGEVVYYAPCGKAFRQYPDIMRYLEKNNITNVTRDHFSFSSKICVGEYIDATTNQRHSEAEVRSTIIQIKEQKAKTSFKEKSKDDIERSEGNARDRLELEAEAILRRLEAEDAQDKTQKDYLTQFEQHNKLSWPGSGPFPVGQQDTHEGVQKEQERTKKQEEQKKEKEERERRRYHGVLVRAIEARKKYEEKERKREEVREEKRAVKERKNAERLHAKEMNQLAKEVKEDLDLDDHQALPETPHVHGLRLPPEAFGNVLMIFEFLHNFGETLGFDMESLPTLQSLQLSMLNDLESEEELLSVLSHLLVCAIEDPGIPAPQRHTTILGQTLNRADITHANISEILRVYLYANATGEVRVIHQLQGTEKERRENPEKGEEWDRHLESMEAYKMSQWLATLPFQALNATQKTEIVAYVCNELLQNKTVVHQIEESLERHNSLKTEKWKLDSRIRKLRMSMARKKIYSTAMRSMLRDPSINDDSNLSASSHGEHGDKNDKKEKMDLDKLKDEEEEHDEDENMSGNESEGIDGIPDEEGDKNLNTDEASKTLEILQKQMEQVRQDLFETCQQVRGFNCGQDRYQRTMWVLPHAGGPFLEGNTSCDYIGKDHFPLQVPPSQEKQGLTVDEVKVKLEENAEKRASERKIKEEQQKQDLKSEVKDEKMDVKTDMKVELKSEKDKNQVLENGEKENRKPMEALNGQVKKEESEEEDEDWQVPRIPECEEGKSDEHSLLPKSVESTMGNPSSLVGLTDGRQQPIKANGTTASGELGSAMSHLSNGIKEGATVVPTAAQEGLDPALIATGLGLVPGQYLRAEHILQREKLTFSLVPRTHCSNSSSDQSHVATPSGTPRSSPRADPSYSPNTFHSSHPSKTNPKGNSKVNDTCHTSESIEEQQRKFLLQTPTEFRKGWWQVENLEILRELINSYSDRGLRERELKRFIEKNYAIVKTALEKVDGSATSLDELPGEDEVVLYEEWGSVLDDAASHWSPEVALKMDLQVVDQVFSMEDKITGASMQNKTWQANAEGERPTNNDNWRASCLPPEDDNDTRLNPVEFGRKRLLNLEDGIERRYLKPPLGISPNLKGDTSSVDNGKDLPKGLVTWREAVANASTAAQLAMCTYMLETAVAWDKSIMKAYCQFCHSGDHEEKLLLCDGCDKGYHTHCFKPPMVNIPEGDWYCYECVNKFSETSRRHCLVCGGTEGKTLIHCHLCPRAYHTTCIRPNLAKIPRNKWMCPACTSKRPKVRRGGRQKKVSESVSKGTATPPATPATTPTATATPVAPVPATDGEQVEDSNPGTPAQPTTPKKEKNNKKEARELSICHAILGELSTSEDAWPFLLPVNTRQFPTYKKIIKKPMDLSGIRKKLEDNIYKSGEDFCEDLRLMFNNCEIFNEDDSPVGKAGHNLRSFFQTKWNEHFPPPT